MNIFMNFIKKSLVRGRTRGKVGALEKIRASSLPVLNLVPASPSSSPMISAVELTQKLCQMVQDPEAIVKNRGLNMIFSNRLADLLGIDFLEL